MPLSIGKNYIVEVLPQIQYFRTIAKNQVKSDNRFMSDTLKPDYERLAKEISAEQCGISGVPR